MLGVSIAFIALKVKSNYGIDVCGNPLGVSFLNRAIWYAATRHSHLLCALESVRQVDSLYKKYSDDGPALETALDAQREAHESRQAAATLFGLINFNLLAILSAKLDGQIPCPCPRS